ncbi:MAG: hypothetical protein D6732_02705 [Methanobacteriota archaeon]|nr:MAG: hypothetical protein D6732_02705 [Euryarchaeota archaeon]
MFERHLTVTRVRQAVEEFNSVYAEMEGALWSLSRAAANDIVERKESLVVEEFIWAIKSWWGVQGVRKEMKKIAAATLLELEWERSMLSDRDLDSDGERFAVERVATFVEKMMRQGAQRREWSLASKILHWLMPWRIPVYDSFVKQALGISVNAEPKDAYIAIVGAEYKATRALLQQGQAWLGDIEPRAAFRALDKYLWWLGGGSAGRAVVVNDPWKIVRSLGIRGC